MRKSILFLTSAAVSLMLAFSACSGDSNHYPVSVSAVTLNKSELQLSVGSAETLKATLNPDNAADKELRWTSGDADIASVSGDGLVTAMAKGATSITVKTNDGGHRATCAVTVYTIPVTSFTLDTNSLTLFAGATHTFTKNILPENASDKGVIWHCSNDYVASVSNEGVVTALGSGAAIITATTRDGGYNASCAITVTSGLDFVSGVTLNKDWLFLDVGQTEKLTATVLPGNTPDKSVTWFSSNQDIASVSSDGLVTAKTKGTVDITVKTNSRGFVAVCSVGVIDPSHVPPPVVSGDVFVATNSSQDGIVVATLWKNGVSQRLSEKESGAESVFVSGDDVYVAGYIDNDVALWKNGVPVRVGNLHVVANKVFVSGGDIYVTGCDTTAGAGMGNLTAIAVLWKNGAPQILGDGIPQTLPYSLFVSGDDIYVAGTATYGGNSGFIATLWKNGATQYLSPIYDDQQYWGTSLSVSGSDVYVVGRKILNGGWGPMVAWLWKNGESIGLADGNHDSEALSCYAVGDDVYIAGFEEVNGAYIATVWKNTELYQRFYDGGASAFANAVFVSGNDIYVSGSVYIGGIYNWVLFKNGALHQNFGNGIAVRSVFVVE